MKTLTSRRKAVTFLNNSLHRPRSQLAMNQIHVKTTFVVGAKNAFLIRRVVQLAIASANAPISMAMNSTKCALPAIPLSRRYVNSTANVASANVAPLTRTAKTAAMPKSISNIWGPANNSKNAPQTLWLNSRSVCPIGSSKS